MNTHTTNGYDPDAEPFRPTWPVEEDLHLHTTASDGTLSPSKVVEIAYKSGLKIVAVTDHDTVGGIDEALRTASEDCSDLVVIPGVELSTRIGSSDIHLLGIFIDHRNSELAATLASFAKDRLDGVKNTVEHLRTIGIELSWDKVQSFASGTLGRPHIARAMVDAGYVSSFKEAFDRYLGDGRPGYLPRPTMTTLEGLKLLHAAGGVGVIAHPRTVKGLAQRLPELAKAGLAGIEVYAEKYRPDLQRKYSIMAKRYALIECGGSDYHANGNATEVMPGMSGPPPGTTRKLFDRALALHAARVGFRPMGWT